MLIPPGMIDKDTQECLKKVLKICITICLTAAKIKDSKDHCHRVFKQVIERVQALEQLVRSIEQGALGQISSTVDNALQELSDTLESARDMVMIYSETSTVERFLKSRRHKEKFSRVNEKLTYNFQVLSGALQVDHGTMLNQVLEAVLDERRDEDQPVSNPAAQMSLPMQICPRTSPMPSPILSRSIMSSHPVSNLAAHKLQPVPVAYPKAQMSLTTEVSNPTAQIHLSVPTGNPAGQMYVSMQVSPHTSPMPSPVLARSIVFHSPVNVPTVTTAMHCISPSMFLSGTMTQIPFSTTTVSQPAPANGVIATIAPGTQCFF